MNSLLKFLDKVDNNIYFHYLLLASQIYLIVFCAWYIEQNILNTQLANIGKMVWSALTGASCSHFMKVYQRDIKRIKREKRLKKLEILADSSIDEYELRRKYRSIV